MRMKGSSRRANGSLGSGSPSKQRNALPSASSGARNIAGRQRPVTLSSPCPALRVSTSTSMQRGFKTDS